MKTLSVKKNILGTLKIIHDNLKNREIRWVIGGSTSLFLQKVVPKPTDIDIMTDKKGAFEISRILREYETKPVKFNRTDKLSSYWGKLRIENVEIDVMGDFSEKVGKKWVNVSENRLRSPEYVQIGDMRIPVTQLRLHLESYKTLNRRKDIEKIKKLEKILNA